MKIQSGVDCLVIGGTDGVNIGKTVTVQQLRGEHSTLGRIWRCVCKDQDLITEYGAVGNTADFAQSWLQPIDPLVLKGDTTNVKEKETTE